MLGQILSSKILQRNAIHLLLLIVTITLVVRAQEGIPFTVAGSFDYSNYAYNSTAWVFGVAWWWGPDFIPFPDPYYVYEGSLCPNGNPVDNYARMHGEEGLLFTYGVARSTVISNGLQRGFYSVGYISPFDNPRATTLINEENVSSCYVGVGGDDPGGCNGYCGGGGDDGGCHFCEANWQHTAACSGPYDHNYCG